MSFEVFEGFPDEIEDSSSTVGERIERMTRLVHAASRASGRELSDLPRSQWPGEIFIIEVPR